MSSSKVRTGNAHFNSRVRIAAAVGVIVAGIAIFAAARTPASPAALPSYVTIERDGFRYEYDALTGRERLYDVTDRGSDPDDVIAKRPDDARRLRTDLERQLGIRTLDELRATHRKTAEALHGLGYL